MVAVSISGGDKLAKALAEIEAKYTDAKEVRVGFLESAPNQNGIPVASIALWQEFGTSRGTPPRPFFRPMVDREAPTWGPMIAAELEGGASAGQALGAVGKHIEGELRQSIVDVQAPPLSPVTMMLRKWFWTNPEDIKFADVQRARAAVAAGESSDGESTKPLVWTGQMLRSINSEVK